MRVNVYAEEITDRVEIVSKEIEGQVFTGVRFYLELPVALVTPPAKLGGQAGIAHVAGPFVHRAGDDDSSAVTFWGKRDLREVLRKALALLDAHHAPGQGQTAFVAQPPEKIGAGARNDTLLRHAVALRQRCGLSETEIVATLAAMNAERCDPPLERAEVERIAHVAMSWLRGDR